MSQRVKTSARGLVLPRSSPPENGHLQKNGNSSDLIDDYISPKTKELCQEKTLFSE
jgi:hypothetical protein